MYLYFPCVSLRSVLFCIIPISMIDIRGQYSVVGIVYGIRMLTELTLNESAITPLISKIRKRKKILEFIVYTLHILHFFGTNSQ